MYYKDEILHDLRRVHMFLEQRFLLFDEIKVLAHQKAHCGGMQGEAVSDIFYIVADKQIALQGHSL